MITHQQKHKIWTTQLWTCRNMSTSFCVENFVLHPISPWNEFVYIVRMTGKYFDQCLSVYKMYVCWVGFLLFAYFFVVHPRKWLCVNRRFTDAVDDRCKCSWLNPRFGASLLLRADASAIRRWVELEITHVGKVACTEPTKRYTLWLAQSFLHLTLSIKIHQTW